MTPRIPVTDQAAMIVPSPSGPSERGTTSVQRSVIVQVISCETARNVTFRPTTCESTGSITGAVSAAMSPEPKPSGTTAVSTASASDGRGALLKEWERTVEDVFQRLGRTRSDRPSGHSPDDLQRLHVARDHGARGDHAPPSQLHARQDRRARADPHMILDHHRAALDPELR